MNPKDYVTELRDIGMDYVPKVGDILAELESAGIRKNSRSLKEYERGKKAVGDIVWGGVRYMPQEIQKIIADYVGV